MADESTAMTEENGALADALAAEHAAVWGYGVVGAALPSGQRAPVAAAENAHRDVRDQVAALLTERGEDPAGPEGGYALPFPVLSAVDAATLAATLEDGAASAWVRVLAEAVERSVRELAMVALGAGEVRAVGWRTAAGQASTTRALPGLSAS